MSEIFIVKFKTEHYSNPYGSICGSTKVIERERSFDTKEEALRFIIKAKSYDDVRDIKLIEGNEIKC